MFNASGFEMNPDYAPVLHRSWAHWAAVAMTLVVLVGLRLIYVNWKTRWRERILPFRDQLAVWTGMLLVSVVVIITQRPRPSYLLVLEVGLIIVCTLSIFAIAEETQLLPLARRLGPWMVLLLFFVVPPFFRGTTSPPSRPLYSGYERLWPHRGAFFSPVPTSLLASGYPFELCSYIVRERNKCIAHDYNESKENMSVDGDIAMLLRSTAATVVYLDEPAIADAFAQPLVRDPQKFGWRTVASESTPGQRWILLQRTTAPGPGGS
jgi:hypothetical protein